MLASSRSTLTNVPRIRDVETMVELLADLGADVEWLGGERGTRRRGRVSKTSSTTPSRPGDPRLVPPRGAAARAVRPGDRAAAGGDVIGRRRLDTHIHAFVELGVEIRLNGGYDLRTTA